MKKITNFVVAIVALVIAVGCEKPDLSGVLYLDVTPNNIAGVWRLKSFDNGIEPGEGTYRYIVFDRKDRTFVSYDNLGSMEVRKRSGRFDIYTNRAAIIRGMYDYGQGDWEHQYYVRNLTQNSMVWVATDDDSLVTVYERAELPEWIPTEEEE